MIDKTVIDASIAVAWVHPVPGTQDTNELLNRVAEGMEIVVPGFWFLEVANALVVLERRRKLTAAERDEALERMASLNVAVDEEGSRLGFSTIANIAIANRLSVYDACYLELAQRKKLVLASLDERLRNVAKRLGLKVY
jgi:predicted nucleic acid-binding protein